MTLQLRLPDGTSAEVPSRVCDHEDRDGVRRVVVDRPDLSGLAEAGALSRDREETVLTWVRPTGRMQVLTSAVAAGRPYGPVWVLTPLGAPTRDQRREYFRTELDVPAVLAPVVDGARVEDARARATLVEVSEGGAQVTSEAGLPEPGTVVSLSFTLRDRAVEAEADVLRHVPHPTGPPRAALRFVDPTAHGDHIRQAALDLQRTRARARRD